MLAFIVGIPIAMHANHMRVEYLDRPLAVASLQPRFSWWVDDPSEGAKQSAYRIEVQKSDGSIAWDSGRREESSQNQIESGKLAPETDYRWRVKLWNGEGTEGEWSDLEPFSTGLDRWTAKWIGFGMPPITPKTSHNGYHAEITKNQNEQKWVEIDLGSAVPIDKVILHPAQPFDFTPDTRGLMFPLDFRIEIDGKTVLERKDEPMPTGAVTLAIPATTGRKIRLVCTRLRARETDNYGLALAEMQVGNGDEILSTGKKATAKDSLENRDWKLSFLTNGDLRSHPIRGLDSLPAVHLRQEFQAPKPIASARLYATALGAYEAYINGKRVGDQILAPEWTDYHTRVQYQAYDVTDLVREGENAIGAILGDGWYAGRLGMAQALDPRGFPRAVYGRQTFFSAELRIKYADGTTKVVMTDPEWRTTQNGPVRRSDLLDGELYDANMELPGWDKPGYHESGWAAPMIATPEPNPMVVPQTNEPIRITKRLKPQSRTEPKPGQQVFEMGQNMVGNARLRITAPQGARVTIRYAEMLNEDGTVYTTNLRGAPQIDTFISAGNPHWFETRFTYHGFRYISVEGAGPMTVDDVEGGVFHSSSPDNSIFETSNTMVNRLWQNIVWTQRANLMSVPTDCPQRDERLGWMGDILAFGQTSHYIMDMAGFSTKWLVDVRDAQAEDGRYPDFAPHPYGKDRFFTGVPGWGDAGVGYAYDLWHNTGDTRLLTEHLDSIGHYLGWVASKNPKFVWENNRHNDYGDWLNGDTLIRDGWPRTGGECPKEVFGTLMWFQSAVQASELAKVLGRTADSEKFASMAAAIKEAFAKEYVSADGKIKGDTQAGYALAFYLGIVPDSDEMFKHLIASLARVNDHITTGFHSTMPLMKTLTRFGRSDLAYKLLLNRDFPSWGYTIDNGATTIWERWDGYVKGRGFQDPGMNSFNHWALGAVGEWMFETVGGIQLLTPSKGGATFLIAPVPGGDLTTAKASLDSAYGRVFCEWKKAGEGYDYTILIPANTTAEVAIPSRERKVYPAGRYVIKVSKP